MNQKLSGAIPDGYVKGKKGGPTKGSKLKSLEHRKQEAVLINHIAKRMGLQMSGKKGFQALSKLELLGLISDMISNRYMSPPEGFFANAAAQFASILEYQLGSTCRVHELWGSFKNAIPKEHVANFEMLEPMFRWFLSGYVRLLDHTSPLGPVNYDLSKYHPKVCATLRNGVEVYFNPTEHVILQPYLVFPPVTLYQLNPRDIQILNTLPDNPKTNAITLGPPILFQVQETILMNVTMHENLNVGAMRVAEFFHLREPLLGKNPMLPNM